jgi:hypothetical protein
VKKISVERVSGFSESRGRSQLRFARLRE